MAISTKVHEVKSKGNIIKITCQQLGMVNNHEVPKHKNKELKYHLGTGHLKKHEEGKLEKDVSSWV